MTVTKKLQAMIDADITREDAIELATAGAAGMLVLVRFEAMEIQLKDEDDPAETLTDVVYDISQSIPWMKKMSKEEISNAPSMRILRSVKGKGGNLTPLSLTPTEVMKMPSVMRHTAYGAMALSVAGGLYWLMRHPEVVTQGIKSTGEFAAAVATATGDVLEDALDWMPF